MQDHIPDALIAAFERQYDTTWNDPQLRNERLAMRYGWAAAMEAKPCLHQIQEPAPATAMDALREAEAALEVAMARILKADPGHSISVTSEAKALVAVRAALADTPADHVEQDLNMVAAAAQVVLPEPDAYANPMDFLTLAKKEPAPWNKAWMFSTHYPELIGVYSADSVSALLATGGQAQAVPLKLIEAINTALGGNDWQGDAVVTDLLDPACRAIESLAHRAQADARDAELLDFIDSHAEGVIRLDAVPNYLHWGKHWEHKTARAAIAAAKGE